MTLFPTSTFCSTGQVGDWKKHLTVAQSELVDAKVKCVLGDTDINFTYVLWNQILILIKNTFVFSFNQYSIHCKNSHGASKRKWTLQTTRDTPKWVQKQMKESPSAKDSTCWCKFCFDACKRTFHGFFWENGYVVNTNSTSRGRFRCCKHFCA